MLNGRSDAVDILKIFVRSIMEWAKKEETTSEEDKANDNDSVVTIEAEEAKVKPGKSKQAVAETLTTITDGCEDVLVFI